MAETLLEEVNPPNGNIQAVVESDDDSCYCYFYLFPPHTQLGTKSVWVRNHTRAPEEWDAFDATAVIKVKEQLARAVPVVFAMNITPKVRSVRSDAVLNEDDLPGEGHAMVAVGYDDARQAFLIHNLWGPSWGTTGAAGSDTISGSETSMLAM